MNRKIGFVLLALGVVLGAIALFVKTSSDAVISAYSERAGTCYIGSTCLHDQTNMAFIVLAIIAAVIFIVGFMVLFFSKEKRRHEKKSRIQKRNMKKRNVTLTPEQKKLYNILREAGPMLQGELVARSGMGKVRVSRTLDRMEMLGVAERRRHGMSNLVVLKNG